VFHTKAIILCIAILILQGFVLSVGFSQNAQINFVLNNVQGSTTDLSKFADKKIVIVFWATDNPASIAELENVHKIEHITDFILMAINTDAGISLEELILFADSKSWDFEILIDRKKKFFMSIFQKEVIPSTLLLDAKHEILEKKQGYIPGDEEWILARMTEI
jgi:peroxiredoxin